MFKNSVKTVLVLAGLGALFLGIGSLFGPTGLVIGLVLGLVFVGGSYWFSDKLAVRAAGAQPVTEAEAPKLYAIVRDLTSRTGMPMPKIYISPAAQPNAFATGRNPDHAAVAVTQGLFQVLDEDEMRGVLAHELSHVANRDILITSVAAAAAMGITFVARMAMWGAMFGGMGGGDRDRDGNIFGMLAMMILAPIAALMLQMALSRFARVRGRSQRRRAAGQRRAAGPRAREDRERRQAGADEHRPRAGDGLHHQSAHRSQGQLRGLVPDPPAHGRARRPAAPHALRHEH